MRVVIADDHAIIRDGIRLMLSGEPSIEVVAEATSGAELLEILESASADIVVLDLQMEGMGGLEVLERLGGVEGAPAVVVLTMHDDEGYLRRAVELGARGYVLKRSGRAELVAALKVVEAGGAHVDPHLTEMLVSLATDDSTDPGLDEDSMRLLRLLAAGLNNRQIMAETGWSEGITKSRTRALYRALGVSRRADAVATALRRRLVE